MHIPQLRKEEEDDGKTDHAGWCLLCSGGFSFERCVPCQDPGDEDLLFSPMEYAVGKVSDLELRMNIVLL